ncbi:MAG: dTDP-4-dehydrorhamnose 3,5-epimerase [Asgard group archaeon]|nr:dTDP-4-dehydrorhamnose 3,5-epimerase [Asgard group archaeon]
MSKYQKEETPIKDLYIIKPTVYGDDRGYFFESYTKKDFHEIGLEMRFVQDNQSKSQKGVLRGLHFQSEHPQGKLVRVVEGKVFDVAVDLRRGSPTYGQYFGVELSAKNKLMFYIPEGFAHGFLTLSNEVLFLYKTTEYYYAEYDMGVIWNDADININWPLEKYGIDKPVLSTRDASLPKLADVDSPFYFNIVGG